MSRGAERMRSEVQPVERSARRKTTSVRWGSRLAALGLLLAVPPGLLAQEPVDSAEVAAVADSIAREVLQAPVAGIAVAVAQGGELVFRRAYGYGDLSARSPLRLSDPHQIGSLTKQFTAAAILDLVEQGRIELDAPIQRYLPEFDTQGNTVTIHHLLNHTSGIRSYTAVYGMNPVSRETVLDTIQRLPFDFAPGERFLYNNSGYYLLGVILEEVTGQPFAQYMEEHFFGPLGLESTSYCGFEGEPIPEGYAPGPDSLAVSVLSDLAFPFAAGGICSTAEDLLEWQDALASGDVVDASSYVRMTTPAVLTAGDTTDYGYGLGLSSLEGRPVVAHGGGIPGYNTYLSYYPSDSLGIAVLVNTSPGHPGRVEEAVARAAFGLERHIVRDLPLGPSERAAYLGRYQLGALQVQIMERDGSLVAQASGQPPARMRYQGEGEFLLDTPQEIRLVFELDGGRATGFVLHQGGQTVRALRIE